MAGAEVVGGVADAPPELDVAAVGIFLLGGEQAAEAGGVVDKFGEVGGGEAVAVGDAGVVGAGHDERVLEVGGGGCWEGGDGHGGREGEVRLILILFLFWVCGRDHQLVARGNKSSAP